MTSQSFVAALVLLRVVWVAEPAAELNDIEAILGSPEARAGLVPDKSWIPAIGDRVVTTGDAAAARISSDLSEYVKYDAANDQAGKALMIERKRAVTLAKGTGVIILTTFRPKPTARFQSPTDLQRTIQQGIVNGATKQYPVEVRVLDGPLKDAVVFTMEKSIGRLVPYKDPDRFSVTIYQGRDRVGHTYPFVRPNLVKKGAGAVDANLRASNWLKEGRRAEKAGELVKAVNAYYFTVKDFTELPQAAEAAKRLRGLGFTRRDDGHCAVDPAKGFKVK